MANREMLREKILSAKRLLMSACSEEAVVRFMVSFDIEKPTSDLARRALVGSIVELKKVDGARVLTVIQPFLRNQPQRNQLPDHRHALPEVQC